MNGAMVAFVGNATRDPELRYTTSGRGVASFGLAVNRRWQRNGEWEEQVSFFNIVCWGDLGENVAASVTKGARLVVMGRLEQRNWETDQGEKRTVIELIADEVGPSLRWATAQIERTERDKGDGGYQADRGGSSGGGSSYRDTVGGDPIYGDEEPF